MAAAWGERTDPASLLLIQSGGLGDLVLTANFLAAVRGQRPQTRVTVACRPDFRSLWEVAPAPPDEIIDIPINPYLYDSPGLELIETLESWIGGIRSCRPDVMVTAEWLPTWFTWLAAAAAEPLSLVAAPPRPAPRGLLRCLLAHFGWKPVAFDGPETSRDLSETNRYDRILSHLGLEPRASSRWNVSHTLKEQAAQWLAANDLEPGNYLVCAPGATPSVPEKRWPLERFAEVVIRLTAEFHLRVLVAGESAEREQLRELAWRAGTSDRTAVLAGEPDQIPLLAGLLSHARAYLANDSGVSHIAQAIGLPGVIVFGGGGWPAYQPWGAGSTGVVYPLPCFGCLWDCLFGHGVCTELVPVAPVLDSARETLRQPAAAPRMVLLDGVTPAELGRIGDASRRYREAQHDRRDRLSTIIELDWASRPLPRGTDAAAPG